MIGETVSHYRVLEKLGEGGMGREARVELSRLQRLPGGENVSAVGMAQIHGALGEMDKAFEWLARAEKQRQGTMVYMNVHPRFAAMRTDPRFAEVARRVGLPKMASPPAAKAQ